MRLITWNCCTGFDRKAAQFFGLNPDIAIVPECSQNDVAKVDSHGYWGLWFGSNPKKGLAVFCRRDWKLKTSCEPCGKWVTRIQLDGTPGFNLLAVWACPVGNRLDNYIGQIYRCVTEHAAWFHCGPVVIAGDFNSNARWDKERPGRNHSEVVRLLESYGVLRISRVFRGEAGSRNASNLLLLPSSGQAISYRLCFCPESMACAVSTSWFIRGVGAS
jgi:exodeoxyribonuclease III